MVTRFRLAPDIRPFSYIDFGVLGSELAGRSLQASTGEVRITLCSILADIGRRDCF